jgi:hypothetical protein
VLGAGEGEELGEAGGGDGGVGVGAVAARRHDAERVGDGVEVRAAQFRQERHRQRQRVDAGVRQRRVAESLQFGVEEADVEGDIVADQRLAGQPRQHLPVDLGEARRLGQPLVAEAGHVPDIARHAPLRVDRRRPALDAGAGAIAVQRDLDDALPLRVEAGRLDIEDGVLVEAGRGGRRQLPDAVGAQQEAIGLLQRRPQQRPPEVGPAALPEDVGQHRLLRRAPAALRQVLSRPFDDKIGSWEGVDHTNLGGTATGAIYERLF